MTSKPARIESLVVLTHRLQGFPLHYYIHYVMMIWQAEGRRILVHQGADRPSPPADAALLHLDMTEMPPEYLALAEGYPVRLNFRPASLAKRLVSRHRVSRDDDYDGAVMVKSDLNCGGLPEHRLAQAERRPIARGLATLRGRRPLRWGGSPWSGRYEIYGRKSEVPAWVWRHPALMVERLLLDRAAIEGRSLYGVRQWLCMGDTGLVLTYRSPEPCIRWRNTAHVEPLSEAVPDAIRRQRAELGVDYGKLDYVVADGEAHLLDVNRTPFLDGPPWSQHTDRLCRAVAAGVDAYAR